MDERVGIIGAGSWGTTLAKIASENGREVLLWARDSERADEINETHRNRPYLAEITLASQVQATHDLQEVAERCQLLVLAVPSHGLRQVVHDLGHYLDGEHVMIHGTKGLEQRTHMRMTEVIRQETCLRKIGVLTGPNLAGEIVERRPAGALIASRYDEVYQRGSAAFHNEVFRVYHGRDVVGAEVGGFFKNIVAVAAGAVDGLGLGENTKALLLTRGMTEMARLGVAMGAELVTFLGMAGVGDLIATCASPLSRNHRVGEQMARGKRREEIEGEMQMVAEGVKTAYAANEFAQKLGLDLPIVKGVHSVLYEEAGVEEALRGLMRRKAGWEMEGLVKD